MFNTAIMSDVFLYLKIELFCESPAHGNISTILACCDNNAEKV